MPLRLLTAADLPQALALSTQAGWNQTPGDWERFLALAPDGSFAAEREGRVVGTVAAFLFGRVGWIAMMLVDASLRGQGIGRELMERALDHFAQRGAASVRLDATALGRPLYERLGFVEQFALARFTGQVQPAPLTAGRSPELELRTATADDAEVCFSLDQALVGADRRELLATLFRERPQEVRVAIREGRIAGFLTSRPGRLADFLGPCVAGEAAAGAALLADASERFRGRSVFADVPLHNEAAVRLVETSGLTAQRTLLRMCRGEPSCERPDSLWCSSGPEKG